MCRNQPRRTVNQEDPMSEYQVIAFRAIDAPVSEKNLKYMQRQSTRAEITPWSFDNEYHFGSFRGNTEEMLRRGYDLHLHYANFGIRTLMLRLPQGLPDLEAAKAYLDDDGLYFTKDNQGPGGILYFEPSYEPGDLDDLWNLDDLPDRLAPLRAEIQDGDLRPLYLGHLAVCLDMDHDPEEATEGPVPAGLKKLSPAQRALAELYGLDDHLISAAQNSPALAKVSDDADPQAAWLAQQSTAAKDAWLNRLLTEDAAKVRREMLTAFRQSRGMSTWPTNPGTRTVATLLAAAETIEQEADHKAAEQAERKQAKKLAAMAANPAATLRETEKLVGERSQTAYAQVAELLADLRTALAGTDKAGLPEQQARKLKEDNPKLHLLTSALRQQGFVKKSRAG
jgi:hypothetical protein